YSQAKIELSLFNMEKDMGETTDVKDKYPEILKKLQALGEKMRAELGDSHRQGKGMRQPGRL
ncbi:MAG: hypothetical protein OSA95_08720, partial [Opitutales bacterium]|nr:hypothetical protein [Opitutales bacterium]